MIKFIFFCCKILASEQGLIRFWQKEFSLSADIDYSYQSKRYVGKIYITNPGRIRIEYDDGAFILNNNEAMLIKYSQDLEPIYSFPELKEHPLFAFWVNRNTAGKITVTPSGFTWSSNKKGVSCQLFFDKKYILTGWNFLDKNGKKIIVSLRNVDQKTVVDEKKFFLKKDS